MKVPKMLLAAAGPYLRVVSVANYERVQLHI